MLSLVHFHPVCYKSVQALSWYGFQNIIQNIRLHFHITHNGITLQYIVNDMDKKPWQGHRTHL